MTPNIAAVIIVLLVVNLLGLLMLGWRISGQSSETRQLSDRVTQLESWVKFAPTHTDLSNLRGDLYKLTEATAHIGGQTQTITQMLKTIQDHLMENDR